MNARPSEETAAQPPSAQGRPIRVLDHAVYRGPNIYTLGKAVRLTLDLGPEERWTAAERASVIDRLRTTFPAWEMPLTETLPIDQVVLQVILAVQQAGDTEGPEQTGLTAAVRGQPGAYHLLYSYDQEGAALLAGVIALRLIDSALRPDWQGIRGLRHLAPLTGDAQAFEFPAALEGLRQLIRQTALDPVTQALVNAAEALGIPVTRLGESPLVQLGQGKYSRQVGSGLTDRTSALALETASHPERLRRLLERVGVPVPAFEVVTSVSAAQAAAAALGGAVVTRPLKRSGGLGVRLNLRTPEQVREGFEQAAPFSGEILIEPHISGRTYRLLVVGGEVVTVTLRRPELPGTDDTSPLPDVHPENLSVARTAALALGLDVAAVDMVLPDIARSVRLGGGVVAVKGLPDIELRPASQAIFGAERDPASDVLRQLYPPGMPSRVPVLAVTGTNGKSTTARMAAHILSSAGYTAGLTTTSGVYVAGERIAVGDATGPHSARMVLHHPEVTAAVLETARGGLLREGLGFTFCDAGAVLNVQEDHLGLRGVDTLEDLAWVKSLIVRVVRPGGLSVLNADDPLTLRMAAGAPGPVALFSVQGDSPGEAVRQHRAAGGLTLLREASASGDVIALYRGAARGPDGHRRGARDPRRPGPVQRLERDGGVRPVSGCGHRPGEHPRGSGVLHDLLRAESGPHERVQ
ncbi:hypothetical protein MF271_19765 (plasmid) [Deinococcus sp. KNUC1210]|uniref:Mur ligase family protein n=1 Tax=Deinococcus sp. KNUC1210 TaxID=2917691 RepID=UPI001EEF7DB1|nr:Mur ligase family protein [Deinococcus sp. KNUC1210]ULH17652.1 hypothetical protein MF271_19765 [Deinococcus sp. KNUC1210]